MKRRMYDICRECGASLDYGEKCDCTRRENPVHTEIIKAALQQVKVAAAEARK